MSLRLERPRRRSPPPQYETIRPQCIPLAANRYGCLLRGVVVLRLSDDRRADPGSRDAGYVRGHVEVSIISLGLPKGKALCDRCM